ncbi:VC0807 family protein [Mycolicibacterium sp. 050232]|uniref:VC0807 family protein n=1 Tax=Mycolicibacterium sp. 050232 TaxID=3113982 RepID=UPI002E28BACF|nr:VC0807 family protein [Mycolicibacterium sp. 050232]MED5814780.1 VC0807 family protein [Mycolicibacterium sp. 050232]
MSREHSLRPVVQSILLDVAPPLIAYYGLRAAGVSEYVALLSATVLAGVKVCYDAIRARRLDPFAGYLMLNFGLSLAVGLATSDARMLMAGNTLVGGIGALLFLGSCVIGTPLTQIVAERVGAGTDDTPGPREAAFVRRVHVSLSAMWGIGLLTGMLISLAIIFSLPVDAANGLNTVVSLTLTALLMVATFVLGKRARARGERLREQTKARQG